MKLNIQTVHFSMKSALRAYIQKRINKFSIYYNRIIGVDLYLILDNQSDQQNKRVEVRVQIPGDDIIVTKQSDTFEKAIDLVASAAERSLVRRKEKTRMV
jgi:putative sigma-54 modulation protein